MINISNNTVLNNRHTAIFNSKHNTVYLYFEVFVQCGGYLRQSITQQGTKRFNLSVVIGLNHWLLFRLVETFIPPTNVDLFVKFNVMKIR